MRFSRVVGGSCCTAGLRAGVPPATRAALLVHLVHGCVLSGTLAPPVWRLCCVVSHFDEVAAERMQGGLTLAAICTRTAPRGPLGAFQGGSGRRSAEPRALRPHGLVVGCLFATCGTEPGP